MKAIIMAGGEGTRLRPITSTSPKPMIPIFGKPIAEHIIELLKKHNITEIAMTVAYMPQTIINYFGDGAAFGVNIHYFLESTPMGTAGSIANCADFIDGDFLVISGDCWTDINLTDAIAFHRAKKAEATVVLTRQEMPTEFGVVITDKNGKITRFLEKPSWNEVFSDNVNTGIYIFEKSIINTIPAGKKYDFGGELFPKLLEENHPIFAFNSSGYWCDVGNVDAYIRAHTDKFETFVSKTAKIHQTAQIGVPAYIGKNVEIGKNAQVLPFSVIGNNSRIGENVSIKKAIIHENCLIGNNSQIRQSVICKNVVLGNYVSIFEGAVVGEKCKIGGNSEVAPRVKIWPKKVIQEGASVAQNIVFGSTHAPYLFGENGVSGVVNVDITPEFATKLGATLGAYISTNIGVGCGSGAALTMLKTALIAGASSTGAEVCDLGVTTLPILRNATRFYGLRGAVYLSLENEQLHLRFLNDKGGDFTRSQQRALEQLFERNDFLRADITKIKEPKNLAQNAHYIQKMVNKMAPLKQSLYINSISGENLEIPHKILRKLGATIYENAQNMIGAQFDEICEKVALTDENGNSITEEQMLYLITLLCIEHNEPKIVLPPYAPNACQKLAEKNGILLINSKEPQEEIQEALLSNDLLYQFRLMFDGVFTVAEVCRKIENSTLHELIGKFPLMNIVQLEVPCAVEKKSAVMRSLAEDAHLTAETKNGVKLVHPQGWVLIIPHKQKALCKIVAEGVSAEIANELCDDVAKKVKKMQM